MENYYVIRRLFKTTKRGRRTSFFLATETSSCGDDPRSPGARTQIHRRILRRRTTMSTTALILMLATWAYILFFTIKFLIKVIKTPMKKADTDGEEQKESLAPQNPQVKNES